MFGRAKDVVIGMVHVRALPGMLSRLIVLFVSLSLRLGFVLYIMPYAF